MSCHQVKAVEMRIVRECDAEIDRGEKRAIDVNGVRGA